MPSPTRDQLLAFLDRVERRTAVTGIRKEHMIMSLGGGEDQDFPEARFTVHKVHRGRKHLGFFLDIDGEKKPVWVPAARFRGPRAIYVFDDGDNWKNS
jgi:hypothetical protein